MAFLKSKYFMDPRYWPSAWSPRVYAVHVMENMVTKKEVFFVCDRKGKSYELDSVDDIHAWVKTMNRLEQDDQVYTSPRVYDILR